MICASILIMYSPLIANTEKFVLVIPRKQIRRSPVLPVRVPVNIRTSAYLKLSPFNSYGPIRPGQNLQPNKPLLQGVNELEQVQDGANHAIRPYKNGLNYGSYTRDYVPHDKLKGGYAPSYNQQRYTLESSRPRQPLIPLNGYGPAAPSYQPIVDSDPYYTYRNSPNKPQPIDRPQQAFPIQPIGNKDLSNPQTSPQQAASSTYAQTVPNNQYEATRTGDLLRESSDVIGKVPASPAIGFGTGGIVIRDSILLDDYKKKIAEFTESWPKLSAFPGAFSSSNAFAPGSFASPSSSVARSSDNLGSTNTIGRQGYEVKEEIDEPPIDFRSMPIISSPLDYYLQNRNNPSINNNFG